jgi:signal transduction histidine kinase
MTLPAIRFASEIFDLEVIAKALRTISGEISYRGLANALLEAALASCGAVRGAVLLSEGSELLAKADASFARETVNVFVSRPLVDQFRLPADLGERVLTHQQTVVRRDRRSALIDLPDCSRVDDLTVMCLPLVHQNKTFGVVYLESEGKEETFTPRCISMISMLASQAAVSFGSAQLFEALRETNMWMVKGQEIGRMGSYRWNTRTLLSRASRECHRIFDIDQDLDPVPFEVFRSRVHPDDLPAVERALAEAVSTKGPFRQDYRVIHRDGTILHVAAVGQFDLGPSGDVELEGIITDVTKRMAAERALTDARNELARAAHLALLGELTGSIVHEVNQPLTGIIASAEACIQWLSRDRPELGQARKSAARVIELSRRAGKVVAGLRSLVRDAQLQFAHVWISDAVEEVLLLSKGELERVGVAVRTDFDTSMPQIKADRVQLQQVVLNLVRNAIEAMAGVNERARVLTASSKMVDDNASVTIADTGVGIDPGMQERLFDTLYTTKADGLGLGLSVCRKIIAAHGGRLWIERNITEGAAFTFTIPLHRTLRLRESS